MGSGALFSSRMAVLVGLIALAILVTGCREQNSDAASEWLLADTYPPTLHESEAIDAMFQYPTGWALSESSESVHLAATEDDLPWGFEYFARSNHEPFYWLYKVSSYKSRGARLLGRERSATEAAEAIAYTFEVGPGEVLEPIGTMQLGGREAATLTARDAGQVTYLVILPVEPGHMVVVSAVGLYAQLDEMKQMATAIARSLQPLD